MVQTSCTRQVHVFLFLSVILPYPSWDVAIAEAYDIDLAPNNGIRYSIEKIEFTIQGKTQEAPTAFTINANDGTIVVGTNDYTDYVGGYFNITVKAEDYRGAYNMTARQTHQVFTLSVRGTGRQEHGCVY